MAALSPVPPPPHTPLSASTDIASYVAYRYRSLLSLTREQTNLVTLHLGWLLGLRIRSGRSVDTSMGMTPLEGLVMGTRSGDLDPAILNLMASKEGLSPHEVESVLNSQSGLLGISGLTNDMKVLETNSKCTTTGACV